MGLSVSEEIKFGARWGVTIAGSIFALLVLAYVVASWAGISLFSLYGNTGAMWSVAVLVLALGGGAAWFAASLLPASGRHSVRGFLFWMGALALVLAFDDLLGLHDPILPRRLGIEEAFTFVAYGVGLTLIVGYFRSVVTASTHYSLLALAVASMLYSVTIDLVGDIVSLPRVVEAAEDPAKILGWVLLTVYLVGTARHAVLTRDRRPPDDEPSVVVSEAL